jgi:hypothetical protein
MTTQSWIQIFPDYTYGFKSTTKRKSEQKAKNIGVKYGTFTYTISPQQSTISQFAESMEGTNDRT